MPFIPDYLATQAQMERYRSQRSENAFADCNTIEQVIGETVGAASALWTDIDHAGEFRSEDAVKVIEQAVERVYALIVDKEAEAETAVREPTDAGWYTYSGGAQTIIFHRSATGQWSAHTANAAVAACSWGYIEQALSVWDLVRLGPVVSP